MIMVNLPYRETRDAGLERQSQVGSVEQQEGAIERQRDGSLHRIGEEIEG